MESAAPLMPPSIGLNGLQGPEYENTTLYQCTGGWGGVLTRYKDSWCEMQVF